MSRLFFPLLLFIILWSSCGSITDPKPDIDYREEMRTFVREISAYAKSQDPDFVVIPQNGHQLVLKNGSAASNYLNAIDGMGQEDLFYGYEEDDQATPSGATNELLTLLDIGKQNGKTILVTDYCSTSFKVNNSYSFNDSYGFISFAAPSRELDVIPSNPSPVHHVNDGDIDRLPDGNNFLYLLNPHLYDTKEDFISALAETNYDIIIIDAFFGDDPLTPADLSQIRTKANGGERMIISYMSIGEAENYRFYWEEDWWENPPEWLARENPNWAGNFKVRYWQENWKQVITGNDSSYTQLVLDAGFDGVYLDIIDAFEFFERQ